MSKTYELVTQRMIEKLAVGVIPWRQPWGNGKCASFLGEHKNLMTLKPYRGINALLTASAGYSKPYWLSYKQAVELGAHVRAGERGTPIVYYGSFEKELEGSDKSKKFMFIKHSTVFNVDQIEGLKLDPKLLAPAPKPQEFQPIAACRAIVEGMPQAPRVQHIDSKAYYVPSLDYVNMPKPESFDSPENYYATLFHELAHSTGHESRLKRESMAKITRFADHAYGHEELVAELTSAFLCAESGINARTDDLSAAYLTSWIKVLKESPEVLIKAASQAQKAADFILRKKD